MERILVIEDEASILRGLKDNLESEGYSVSTASDGKKGLEKALKESVDLVLLDLMLPDIDGLEVLKIIRKVSTVPVIVITGHPQDVSEIHLADLKIEGYIEKPISLATVLNTLKFIIGE